MRVLHLILRGCAKVMLGAVGVMAITLFAGLTFIEPLPGELETVSLLLVCCVFSAAIFGALALLTEPTDKGRIGKEVHRKIGQPIN